MGYIKRHKRGFDSIKHTLHIEPTEEEKIREEQRKIERRKELRKSMGSFEMLMGATLALTQQLNKR